MALEALENPLSAATEDLERAELEDARFELGQGRAVRYGVGPGRVVVCETLEDVMRAQAQARRG